MNNNEVLLLNELEKILGNGIKQENGEVAFFCPFCRHHKRKLQVNLYTQRFHCWVCDEGGHKLYFLLKKLSVSRENISNILSLIGDQYFIKEQNKKISNNVILPEEYKPMWVKSENLIYRHTIKYLKSRNINLDKIMRYSIGYCDSGIYTNRVIIPSYNCDGLLNYFIGRDIFPNSKMKYKNSSSSKDVAMFELYTNWNKPIVLVEGVMDAIEAGINTIPLLGKFPSKVLIKKILVNKVKDVYIALDSDARREAIKLSELLRKYNINTYIINIENGDPAELGFRKFWQLVDNTSRLQFSDLIKRKLYG
jgi:DNA primase|tara:strand:- start:5285 stop:6208 length:924 start_codon:yes stop_codon:yes gene_type:complete